MSGNRRRSLWEKFKGWTIPTKISVVAAVFAFVVFVVALAIARWPKKFQAASPLPSLPGVSIASLGVDPPSGENQGLSVADLQNRRLHVLTISNPSTVTLSSLALSFQFPEAVLAAKPSEPAPVYEVKAEPDFASQPLSVSGPATEGAPTVTGSGKGLTGLWKVFVTAIPPRGSVSLAVTTTDEAEEGEPYNAWAAKAEAKKGEVLWLIEGSYQYVRDGETETAVFDVPLTFDRSARKMFAGEVRPGPLKEGERIRIEQGRGVRIPGVFRTGGYILSKDRDGAQSFEAPVMLDRLDIKVKVEMFGSPLRPGVVVEFKEPIANSRPR